LVGKAEHLRGEADSKSQADVKSLMADFLASTRNPIGASGLFSDAFEARPTETRESRMKRSRPGRDLFWVLLVYLLASAGAIVVAAVYLLT
jgi:hypothetical protein